jgi:RNase P/RNase MRP subunit POP5
VTVRDKVGRNRYIVFFVTPPVPKARLLAALKSSPGERPWLVQYDGSRGLVRCAHTAKDATIAFLNALRVENSVIRTTGTSGTIRKARAKFLSNPRE